MMKNNRNNRGFSYVEMLMVLAIMAIMVGLVTISIGLVGRNSVKRTGEELESLIKKARTSALTKGTGQGYLNIALVDGAVYAYVGENLDKKPGDVKKKGDKICNSDIVITVTGAYGGKTTDTVEEEDGGHSSKVLRVFFKQSTGAPTAETTIDVQKKGRQGSPYYFVINNVTGKISR